MFVIDRSLYLSPEVVVEPGLRPLKEVEPFSRDLRGFAAWLETQDGATEYNHRSHIECPICQFASAIAGKKADWLDAIDMGLVTIPWPRCLQRAAYPYCGDATTSTESTYAGALSRARKLLAEREK